MNPLLEFLESQAAPSLPGPLNNLPAPARALVGLTPVGLPGKFGALNDADQQAARALTGALLLANARANPALRMFPQGPGSRMARQAGEGFDQAQGNVFARLIAANEAGAHGNEIAAGLLNAETDPANLAGPLGKVAEAARLGKLAEILGAADRVQNLPGEALGKVAAPVAGKLLAGLADRQAARAALTKVVGNVPAGELPRIGGRKQLGPIRPPEQFGYAKGNVARNDIPLIGGRKQLGPVPPPGMVREFGGGQVTLPQESGIIPADRLRLGLDRDQFDFLDELRGAVQRGKQPEIAAAREWATDVMGIPADRVGRTIEEAYQALDAEDRVARIAAIEGSPYFAAFPHFKKDGALRPVNPSTGKRIPGAARALEQVWNLPGSGYDEVADGILARYQAGGHNQNYGQSTDDFWRGAQDAFKEYQALKKPAATAALPEVASGGIPASAPLTPEITPEVGPDWTHYGPETLYPGEDVTPELLDRFAGLRRFPNATAREIEDALGWARNDVSKLVSTAYNDVPKAIGNARTKYADPAALVQRSIERINASEALRARLWERDPDLARRAGIDPLASTLPDNAAIGATPPPINAQGYSIDEIVARHTPPVPLANVDIPATAAAPTGSLADAIAAHRALPGHQRAAAIGDIYREAGAPKEVKGIGRSGEEIVGYAYSPDLFIKSDATGAPIRHYVTLPNGMRVHPDELRRATITPEGAVRFAPPEAAKVKVGSARARGIADLQGLLVETMLPGANSPRRAAAEALPVKITLNDGRVVDTTAGAVQAAAKRLGGSMPVDTFVSEHLDTGAALSNVDMLPAITDPAERAAWQARYVGQSQAGTDILAAGDTVAGGDLTQADLNALSPRERMAALRKLAGGGDIAAGGGGFGLVPARLGTTLAGAGIGTGVGGLAGGGLGLAAGHEGDQLKEDIAAGAGLGALAGGSVGSVSPEIAPAAAHLATEVGAKFGDTGVDPGLWADAVKVGWRHFQDVRATAGVGGPKEAFDAFWRQWRSQVVNTFKQVPQDALTRKFVQEGIARKEFGLTDGDIRAFQGVLRRERAGGVSGLDNPLTARLRALGASGALADMQGTYGVDFGTELDQQAGKQFGGLGRALAGAGIGLGSGVKTVNPIGPLYGAARGYAAPFVDGMIRFVNGIQHDAFRYALGTRALDRDIPRMADGFLQDLAGRGVDTAQLAAKGGYFAPEEVAAVAGRQAGEDWATLVEATIRKQGDRIAFLAGDFRKSSETGAERAIGKAVPFARWSIRYAPVLAEIAARHPVATLYVLREMDREQEQARAQGKQAYQAGIAVSDTTPLVGLAVRARNGGSAGTVTLDPLGALVPYGDVMGGSTLPDDATGYQRATDLAGRVGFQPNPAIQAAMYVAGQGRAPASLSRTAGLEGLADTAPVLARALLRGTGNQALADRVPDLALPGGRTILDAARGVIAPAVEAAGLPTTGGGPSDPAERRYAEIVLARTGKPLSDPSNRGLLETMGSTDNPLWQLAILQSRAAGAAGNAASMTSPVQTTAQTRAAAAAQAAPKLPYTSFQISQAPKSAQPAMLAANAAAARANPASATYTNISGKSRTDQLVSQWEREHVALKRVNPTYYASALKQYKASLK